MATIAINSSLGDGRHYWETVTGSDVGAELILPKGGAQIAIHVTGTFGDTLTFQGTIDGTNWFTLLTGPGGTAVELTAAGYAEVSTAVYAVRPSAGASISDVDVYVRAVA